MVFGDIANIWPIVDDIFEYEYIIDLGFAEKLKLTWQGILASRKATD